MMEEQQNEFRGWAKVEVMGHQTHIGFVTTQVFGTACLFRVDQPEIAAEERTLERDEWTARGIIAKGTTVTVPAIPAASVLIGSASIYRLTPCTEEAARKAIVDSVSRPLIPVGIGLRISGAVDSGTEPDIDFDDDMGDHCAECGRSLESCEC